MWIWDVRNLGEVLEKNEPEAVVEPWQKRESSLKFMTRAVRAMPNDQGKLVLSFLGLEWQLMGVCRLCDDVDRGTSGGRVL